MIRGGSRRLATGDQRLAFRSRFEGIPPALAQHVVTGIDEHPVYPGGEARGSAEGGRPTIDLQKAVLYRVLRVGEVAEQVRRNALHACPVHLVQVLKGRDVPGSAFFEERLVIPWSARAIRVRQIPLLRKKGDTRTFLQWRPNLHLFPASSTS